MANICINDIYTNDMPLQKLMEEIKAIAPYGNTFGIDPKTIFLLPTHPKEAPPVCVSLDTKWTPCVDLVLKLTASLKVSLKLVYSELGNIGVGVFETHYSEGKVYSHTSFTSNTPESVADISYVIKMCPELKGHISPLLDYLEDLP